MSYSTSLKKAKAAIQKWARMRDADENGIIRCACCGHWKNWKNSDGAHFINATYLATCFAEININACCKQCNGFNEGEKVKYRKFMIEKYGQDKVDELERMSNLNRTYYAFELEAIARLYTDRQKEFYGKRL